MRRLPALAPLLLVLAAPAAARADEGMYPFDAFPSDQVEARHGFRPDAAWLEGLRLASIRIAQGCSGSFVSADGLVMTNHHCVQDCLEQRSSARRDLLKDGLLARTPAEELRCPDLEVNQLTAVEDVTGRVQAATRGLDGEAFRKALDAETAALEAACQRSDRLRCEVVALYGGGRYALHTYRRFQDVRLVFAPELAAAAFGGDPDNFEFPRYDLDVAFARVYDDGAPLHPGRFLRWSAAGPREGEPTFTAGNPGRTHRDLTLDELAYEAQVRVPERLSELSELRGLLLGFQLLGPEQRRVSTSLLLEIENSRKVYRGLLQAMARPEFQKALADREARRRALVDADPARAARARAAEEAIAGAQLRRRALHGAYEALEAGPERSQLFAFARRLVRGAAERARPDAERLPEYTDAQLPGLTQALLGPAPVSRALEAVLLGHALSGARERLGPDHPAVRRLLGSEAPEALAARAVRGTRLTSPAVRRALWQGGAAAVAASQDPLVALARRVDADARAARKAMEDQVDAVVAGAAQELTAARFQAGATAGYPDATFTPRVSFGAVRGWTDPLSGTAIAPFTTFGGAFARHTGREPFALPPSWLRARARLDPAAPLDFTTDNDIVGGNSGSPVVNRDLEVVGLVFDGNFESIAGDYLFEPAVNRTVAVDSRALLLALERIYGARRLADELRGTEAAGAAAARSSRPRGPAGG